MNAKMSAHKTMKVSDFNNKQNYDCYDYSILHIMIIAYFSEEREITLLFKSSV